MKTKMFENSNIVGFDDKSSFSILSGFTPY